MVTRSAVLLVLGRVLIKAFLVALAVVVIYPLVWMMLNGVKSNSELFSNPFALPVAWKWDNYVTAWNRGGVGDYLTTSVLVTVASTVATVFISAWAAYGLTRVNIPFNRVVLVLILGGLMLAPTVALIPLVKMFQSLGLYNNLWALLILYTAFRVPFTTFLIRAYMMDLPAEVDEAASVDGASKAGRSGRSSCPCASRSWFRLSSSTSCLRGTSTCLPWSSPAGERCKPCRLG